jgi:hypothetical protein
MISTMIASRIATPAVWTTSRPRVPVIAKAIASSAARAARPPLA